MDRDLYARVEQIFDAVVELPEHEREPYLIQACDGSEQLLNHLRRLLDAEERTNVLDRPIGRAPLFGAPSSAGRALDSVGSKAFLASVPTRLDVFRRAATDIVLGLQLGVSERDPKAPVSRVARQVARADLVIAVIGWQAGEIPSVEKGGDGLRPWVYWELQHAFECEKPVVILLADESLRQPTGGATSAEIRAFMADFRGELGRLAVLFGSADQNGVISDRVLEDFRTKLRQSLRSAQPVDIGRSAEPSVLVPAKPLAMPPWPERPYPLLLPYSHPELLAGRDRDLDELRRLLARPIPILGLSAASGMGKSSLLLAGLVPRLRQDGRAVAIERHPAEPGLALRLVADLSMSPDLDISADPAAIDLRRFIDHLAHLRASTGAAPVLVIDQMDDLFRDDRERDGESKLQRARASLGMLVAISAQRLPGLDEPPCRWLLACRQETHGRILQWLADVLCDARAEGLPGIEDLPHDFSSSSRFHSVGLRAFGAPEPGARDPLADVTRVFQAAIEQPLALVDADGEARYPWRFAGEGAGRLAGAFAAARLARPGAPLVPELQAVLSLLLDEAGEPEPGRPVTVHVPADPEVLLDRALERHLRRALAIAFPTTDREGRVRRTRALLALRELADSSGRRRGAVPIQALTGIMGDQGLLDELATPQTRLVILERLDHEWVYTLSHDRLGEVVARLFDNGRFGGLGADVELLRLRRFVSLRSALFEAGDTDQATRARASVMRRIDADVDAVIWGDARRRWWSAARERWRAERRRQMLRGLFGVVLLMALVVTSWKWASRWDGPGQQLDLVTGAEPETAFAALARLTEQYPEEEGQVLAAWRDRDAPFDVFEMGLGALPAGEPRARALVRVATLGLSILADSPTDAKLIASLVWALDFFAAAEPSTAERARSLRYAALKAVRELRPPPPLPAAGDPDWADIPAGTFFMGTSPDEGRDRPEMLDERPRHAVTLSAFRMQIHEVTQAEYRRFSPGNHARDRLPQIFVSWFDAYAYAAWLGGRLPTEAEAEYAARAGCEFAWCRRDGTEAELNEVAWNLGNVSPDANGRYSIKEVMGLEPNPWGLYDMLGNVGEWNANWLGAYPAELEVNPSGPTSVGSRGRSWRGGSVSSSLIWMVPNGRGVQEPEGVSGRLGMRVVIPTNVSAERAVD